MREIRKPSNDIESTRTLCLSQFNMKQKEKEFVEIENKYKFRGEIKNLNENVT